MIIDFHQKKESVEISYVNEKGFIDYTEIFLESDSINGFYKIVVTDEYDPDKLEGLVSFHGNYLKKIPAKRFEDFNQNDFIYRGIKNLDIDLHNKLNILQEPLPFSFDIETEMTEEYGWSSPEMAQNRILSISITDINLNTVILVLNNPDCQLHNDLKEKGYIDNILKSSLRDYYNKGGENQNEDIKYEIQVFQEESQMLNIFLDMINKYFHLLFGWNNLAFDWLYILNRCKRLGISVEKASPVKSLRREKPSVNIALNIPVKYPKHRLMMDYMNIVKYVHNTIRVHLDSYSLNSCASYILQLNKVSYDGNLRTLYRDDYLKFIAYALVDSILVMLIHKNTKFLSTFFFKSYYHEIPFLMLNQNPISYQLIYKKLLSRGIFMPSEEFPNNNWRSYIGGYVKAPTKKFTNAMMGVDFSALYPSAMITGYLSPETKMNDKILMSKDGTPMDEENQIKFDEYKKLGHCITPIGNIYRVDSENIFSSIEKDLLDARKVFKDAKSELFLNIIPKILKEIENRGQNI